MAVKEYAFNPLQAQKEIRTGNYYFKKGSYRAAAGRFEEATKWNGGEPEAWLRLGEAEEKRLRELVRSDNSALRQSARKRVKALDEYAAHKKIQAEAFEKRRRTPADDEAAITAHIKALHDVNSKTRAAAADACRQAAVGHDLPAEQRRR